MKSAIEKLVAAEIKTIDCHGETVRLKRMRAIEGMKLHEASLAMPEGEADKFLALVLSKTIVEEDGSLSLDSDSGRELLGRLPLETLIELGEAAMEWAGLNESKKN